MTEKEQIIIDGVDVAGCKYFNRFRSICHNKNLCCDCEKNQDCYYKQLARKEQECEKLKSQMDEDYNYYTTELKTLRDIISNKEKRNAALFLTSGRYRKALKEIEDISDDYNRVEKTSQYYRDGFEKILDIISKVKGGEDE